MEQFLRNRLSQLISDKGVSEYQMSYALGHCKSYINGIVAGKSLPSMKEFFAICDYFEITPSEFFHEENPYPVEACEISRNLNELSLEDVEVVRSMTRRLLAYSKRLHPTGK